MYTIKAQSTPMGGRLYSVRHTATGQPATFSLYWNGPGARLQLGIRPTEVGGMLTGISAPGYSDPVMSRADADKLAASFLADAS